MRRTTKNKRAWQFYATTRGSYQEGWYVNSQHKEEAKHQHKVVRDNNGVRIRTLKNGSQSNEVLKPENDAYNQATEST